MRMSPAQRKAALSVHLTVSVGWLGAVVAYLAVGVSAVTAQDAQTVRAAWFAMELTIGWVIAPLAVASVATGVVMGLGTTWGLVRHYWVLISFVLTVAITVFLLFHMQDVRRLAAFAQAADDADLAGGLGGDLFHAGLGLVLLVVIQALNVAKPKGLTRYGRRKQREEQSQGSA